MNNLSGWKKTWKKLKRERESNPDLNCNVVVISYSVKKYYAKSPEEWVTGQAAGWVDVCVPLAFKFVFLNLLAHRSG